MQSPQAKLTQIRRILALWPAQAQDDGEELLRAYLFAADDYPTDDVEAAVNGLVKGTAPGINPSFRPKPSEVGAECRRQMNVRLDSEHRAKVSRPALPPPDVQRTPESMARVAAATARAVANLASAMLTEDAADAKRKRLFQDKVHARFDPQSEREMAERLGYSAGDPDGERFVA